MTAASDKLDVPPEKWHVTLMEMVSAVYEAFLSKGKAAPEAEACAEIAVDAIYTVFRGNYLYIPFSTATKKAAIHARIFAEFDGHNQQELSRRYEMSVQAIYRIIKKQRELNRIPIGETDD